MADPLNNKDIACSFLSNSDDYIVVSGPDRILKFVNKAYCTLFKSTSRQLVGTPFTDALSPDQQAQYFELEKQMLPATPTITATVKLGASDNQRLVSWKVTGVYDEDGSLTEILSVGRNVSAFFEARQEKDRLLLAAFRKAIDTNIICTITDTKGVITHANDRFCKVSQYAQSELIGKTHNFVNSGHHPKSFFSDMWRTIATGQVWTGQIKNKAKDGSFYWVESVIMAIKDENEKVTGYLSLRILINEQKKLEEERNRYIHSLEEMLFMVSHEIRKPITGCQGILNLMVEDMPRSKTEYYEYIEHLMTQANDLDSYSRKLNAKLERNLQGVHP